MRQISLILLLAVLTGITLLHFNLITESTVSIVGTFLLLIGGDELGIDWDPSLTEFRVAAVVWVPAMVFLCVMLIRRMLQARVSSTGSIRPSHRPTPMRAGVILVAAMGVVSLTCPFLVPFGPDVHGDPTTTALLPPLSSGRVTVLLKTVGPRPPQLTGLSRRVFEANNYLRHRKFVITAGEKESHDVQESTPRVIASFPILFVFGTDVAGRDMYSRVIYGTRISFIIGLCATIGAMMLGLLVGVGAGMGGRTTDMVLMRFTDTVLSIPDVFIIIGFMAFLSQSMDVIILVLALTGWMSTARSMRNQTRLLREREFVLAARMLRVPASRIILRHILPNMSHLISTAVVLQFANAVLGEATIGFLGLGIQPPAASWGNMIGEGSSYLQSAWWISLFPGFVLAAVLVCTRHVAQKMEQTPVPRFPLPRPVSS